MISLLAGLFLLAGSVLAAATSVILLIGDGMGPNQVKAGSIKWYGADGKSAMQSMPIKGSLVTTNVKGEITDSGAAGTALATGHKTNNGMIAVSPDGKVLKTILEACRDSGKSVGVVATSTITHATPASFSSHVKDRGTEYEIASQMVGNRLNVIFGGGKDFFLVPKGDVYIGIDVMDANDKKILSIKDKFDQARYTEVDRGFLAPPGAVKASVWLWRGGSAVDAFLDDFSLVAKGGKDQDDSGNLLANADFEASSTTGWNIWKDCTVAVDGGSKALKVGGGGGAGGDQTVAIKAGGEFEFKYRVRVADAGEGPKRVSPWDAAGKAGYRRIEKRDELAGVKGKYVLGLFKPSSLEATPDEPTLPEMTGAAIRLLSANPKGFFLMVEGSQIDWAPNDDPYFFREIKSMDDSVRVALDYAAKAGNVLVVVTADHETGGLQYEGTDAATLKLKWGGGGHTATNTPVFAKGPGSEPFTGDHDNTDIPKLIARALGMKL
jgi:alkaline phosphatase